MHERVDRDRKCQQSTFGETCWKKNAPEKPLNIGKDNINMSHRDVGCEGGG